MFLRTLTITIKHIKTHLCAKSTELEIGMEKKIIYLDHAATTPARPEVIEAMIPYFGEYYGNPSSLYELAGISKKAVAQARQTVAKALNCDSKEIYFTGGGSEADNWALKEAVQSYANRGRHIITSKVEHHAILHTCKYLEQKGYLVTYLNVDENGIINLKELQAAIRPDTILISIMFANNEIGTLQPIKEIGQIARKHQILFHTDAVQAFCQVPIDVEDLKIDLLSASGHKFNGPKGVGFLYIRNGLKLRSFIHGGGQERHRRAGTENVPGIVGLGKAVELAMADQKERMDRETKLRDYLLDRILMEIPYTRINGHRRLRLPNNANFSFQFIEGEALLIMLDLKGICASTGSACSAGSVDPSHVLLAIGLPNDIARSSLRLTLGRETTKEEIDETIDAIKEIVTKLRSMSSAYEDFLRWRGNRR